MHPLVWIAAALGGVAIWRRKTLKDDAEKMKSKALEAKTVAGEKAVEAKTVASEKIAAARGGSSEETTEDETIDISADAVADAEDVEDEVTTE